MRVPSGLQRGASSVVSPVVSRRTWPVATSTVQRLLVFLFLSIDHSSTGNTPCLPSGDNAGEPTRLIAHKSCGVSNRGSAAKAATEKVRATRTAKKKRDNMQPAIAAAAVESKQAVNASRRMHPFLRACGCVEASSLCSGGCLKRQNPIAPWLQRTLAREG